ncbi:MAG: DUF4173 domain-containing protein, partial [Chloroflexi bacterium]|nr:DUF4173 domain-containing protein [Chloroflexota bacterium]
MHKVDTVIHTENIESKVRKTLPGRLLKRLPGQLPGRILLVGLALGWGFDGLFYGKALGVSWPLFAGLLLVALFWLGRSKGIHPSWRNLWLLLPLGGVAAMVAVRANGFLLFWNVVATLCLLALVAHFYTGGRLETLGLVDYPAVLARVGGNALVQAAPLVPAAVDLARVYHHGRRGLLPVARGFLLAVPVLFIFTLFLTSADLVFAAYVRSVFSLHFFPTLAEWLWRGPIILFVAWFLAGGLAYALLCSRGAEGPDFSQKVLEYLRRIFRLGLIEASTILTLVDALFLAFVWVQFIYLFGGLANISLEGFTYAEYARRGFFELVAVSMMTL